MTDNAKLAEAIEAQTRALDENTAAMRLIIESNPRTWNLPTKKLVAGLGKSKSTICRMKRRRSTLPDEERRNPAHMAALEKARAARRRAATG